MRIYRIAVSVMFTGTLLAAQTAADLNARYKPIQSYEIRPGILMIPNFSADGQLCRALIVRSHLNGEVVTPDSSVDLDPNKLQLLIDELAPPASRGKLLKPDDISTVLGGGEMRESEFENVTVLHVGAFRGEKCDSPDVLILISWKQRGCRSAGAPSLR